MITYYLYFAVAMGLAEVVDGIHLYRTGGRISSGVFAFSLLEYAWAAVSCWLIWKHASELQFPLWYPGLFVLYIAIGFVLGCIILSKSVDTPQEDVRMPPAVAVVGGSFGAVYFLLGVYFAASL